MLIRILRVLILIQLQLLFKFELSIKVSLCTFVSFKLALHQANERDDCNILRLAHSFIF
jgi:hypothetical protein